MTWRSVVINQPARLRREHFALVVEQETSARVPFEDIAVIVLHHREIVITHPVLSACAEYGIGLFSTGDNHQPNGVFLPYLSHSRATRMLRLQLAIDKPLAKRTWAAIVRSKIENQARCLKIMRCERGDELESIARRVRSGDPDNLEAQASAIYFRALFGASFDRAQNVLCNAGLDYGYSILRGTIARALVAHGFMPSIGLFHRSEQNAFNLADDIIEPFRPVVDMHVAKHLQGLPEGELQPKHKTDLVSLLNVDVGVASGKTSVLAAIEAITESLVRLYERAATRVPTNAHAIARGHARLRAYGREGDGRSEATPNDPMLDVPTLIGLAPHQREM
jgi:CRISP-associated protein Cas1